MRKLYILFGFLISIFYFSADQIYSQVPANQKCLSAIPLLQQAHTSSASFTYFIAGNY